MSGSRVIRVLIVDDDEAHAEAARALRRASAAEQQLEQHQLEQQRRRRGRWGDVTGSAAAGDDGQPQLFPQTRKLLGGTAKDQTRLVAAVGQSNFGSKTGCRIFMCAWPAFFIF